MSDGALVSCKLAEHQLMDSGLCTGNYHDYENDEVALQREIEMGDGLVGSWHDPAFPADARSLYFDPLNPPKGALPGNSMEWHSICEGGVVDCTVPVTFNQNYKSVYMECGALGDKYLVNALRLLACQPKYISRLLVSSKFASTGIYTIKFFKMGKWRYVHIDDRIPCRQSGAVNYCRNLCQNETFAMLIEKAFAKLHGCYEALAYGMVETILEDLTPAAHVQCLRSERLEPETICDVVWDAIEAGIQDLRLLGCSRAIPDPYGENASDRQGITLGVMYQIMDACVVTSDPTEELDGITIGMICVRNLQRDVGRFLGRWSFSHPLWESYEEIALDLRNRTREIQYKRGLGPDPRNIKPGDVDLIVNVNDDDEDMKDRLEEDDLKLNYLADKKGLRAPQPSAEDLYWIQIEDFVDIFNRVYIVNDLSWDSKFSTRRYCSKWMPGDFIVGSGGPPLLADDQMSVTGGAAGASVKHHVKPKAFVIGAAVSHASDINNDNNINTGDHPTVTGGGDGGDHHTHEEQGHGEPEEEGDDLEDEYSDDEDTLGGPSLKSVISSMQPTVVTQAHAQNVLDVTYEAEQNAMAGLSINDNFTDNPMYPISVSEPTTVCVCLYQHDRRWSTERLGLNPRDVTSSTFASRGNRLAACMTYPVAIGFLVVKLCGLKMRLTEFKLKKIAGSSDSVVFAGNASSAVFLRPGRYAIVPFTNSELSRSMDYILHFQYLSGSIDFEVTDLMAERHMDDMPSDEDEDEEEPEDDDDDDDDDDNTAKKSIMEQERRILAEAAAKVARQELKPPPRLHRLRAWEYEEDTEEQGVISVYSEVGNLAQYVKSLRVEVQKLQMDFKDVRDALSQAELQAAAPASTKTTAKPRTAARTAHSSSQRGSPLHSRK